MPSQALVTDVSTRLRTARQRAGLEIAEISARTKIKVAFLHAIERGEFERLPGQFFTRAFLKAYAKEVGVSPDEIAADYDESCDLAEAAAMPPPEQRPVRQGFPSLQRPPNLAFSGGLWPVAALATILLAVAAFDWSGPEESREAGAVGTSGVVAAGAGVPGPAPVAEPTPEKLKVDIHPTAIVWVAATSDGQRAIYRLLQPGERVSVEAQNGLSFRIGNAAAFEYSINGVPGKPVGGPDEVAEFTITPENYRAFRR